MCRGQISRFIVFGLFFSAIGHPTRGQDLVQRFRIDTKVYLADDPEPISQNLTLFRDGIVYDFLSTPPQVAVFENRSANRPGRFTLLDPGRKRKSEVTTDWIDRTLKAMRTWASKQEDPLLKFAADPHFDVQFDPQSGELLMESPVMRYKMSTELPRDSGAMARYREYSDWYGRLGAVTNAGSLPPFPRLKANELLAKNGRIAHKVELTIRASKRYRKSDLVMRADHRTQWRLSKLDLQKIDQVNQDLATFTLVKYKEFQPTIAEQAAAQRSATTE